MVSDDRIDDFGSILRMVDKSKNIPNNMMGNEIPVTKHDVHEDYHQRHRGNGYKRYRRYGNTDYSKGYRITHLYSIHRSRSA